MKDRRGAELQVGDIAVHASSGRYGAYDVVRIARFTAKRVVVDKIDYGGTLKNFDSPSTDITSILEPSTLIKATLPYVEGRLNN